MGRYALMGQVSSIIVVIYTSDSFIDMKSIKSLENVAGLYSSMAFSSVVGAIGVDCSGLGHVVRSCFGTKWCSDVSGTWSTRGSLVGFLTLEICHVILKFSNHHLYAASGT